MIDPDAFGECGARREVAMARADLVLLSQRIPDEAMIVAMVGKGMDRRTALAAWQGAIDVARGSVVLETSR